MYEGTSKNKSNKMTDQECAFMHQNTDSKQDRMTWKLGAAKMAGSLGGQLNI